MQCKMTASLRATATLAFLGRMRLTSLSEQPGIGGDDRTAKLEHQPAVEIDPERLDTDLPAGFDMKAILKSA